jgi:hypothetical protein
MNTLNNIITNSSLLNHEKHKLRNCLENHLSEFVNHKNYIKIADKLYFDHSIPTQLFSTATSILFKSAIGKNNN